MIWLIPLSIVSAVLYYFGGERHKQIRRFGCPIVALLTLWLLGVQGAWWAWIIAFGANYGVMTSYFKGDAEDCKWYHWLITGIAYSLAMFPFVIWGNVHWVWFLLRTVSLGLLTMLLSEKFNWVVIEAGGRGFLYNITLALLKL